MSFDFKAFKCSLHLIESELDSSVTGGRGLLLISDCSEEGILYFFADIKWSRFLQLSQNCSLQPFNLLVFELQFPAVLQVFIWHMSLRTSFHGTPCIIAVSGHTQGWAIPICSKFLLVDISKILESAKRMIAQPYLQITTVIAHQDWASWIWLLEHKNQSYQILVAYSKSVHIDRPTPRSHGITPFVWYCADILECLFEKMDKC